MRISVVGARGMLGKQVVETALSNGHTVIPWVRPDVDITNVESLIEHCASDKPDAIINCAAWTDVDGAETNIDAAFLSNKTGAGNLAKAAAMSGIRLVHISTDFVYPGDVHRPLVETDTTGPQSVYGKSKLAGEAAVLEAHSAAVIVRTGYIFGHHGANLIDKIATGLKSGYTMPFVTDQWITPTGTPLLADACLRSLESDLSGIYHVTQGGGCTTFEMASFIAEQIRGSGTITSTTLREWEPVQSARCQAAGRILAKRPIYSVLNTQKFCSEVSINPLSWRDAIKVHFSR